MSAVQSPARRDVLDTMVAFARTLRAAGVAAGPDRVQSMCSALDELDVLRRQDAYWAGRLTLCGDPEDIRRYDLAFEAFFAGEQAGPPMRRASMTIVKPFAVPVAATQPAGDNLDDANRLATASPVEVLRHRDVARLDAAEREQIRRMLARIDPVGPTRRSRRWQPTRRGPLDPGRTVRAMLRRGGEPAALLKHDHRPRPRRLVLVIDVSGSMEPYADAMLRFAHACARRRTGTEVFTIGTRLTRISREIRQRDPDRALAAATAAIPDWSGGTRLGELLKAFLDRWGQRGTARGAVVVIASDGWERGDATLLAEQMARLQLLAFKIVWANPHKGKRGYAPVTAGMAAALPHVDAFVAGHTVAALEALAAVISNGGTDARRPG